MVDMKILHLQSKIEVTMAISSGAARACPAMMGT